MPMIDLAYSDEERKEIKGEMSPTAPDYEGPKYPWGLEFSLENASLDKLGLDLSAFKIGQELPLNGVVRVVGLDQNERDNGEAHRCVRLLITKLDNGQAASDEDRASRMYKDAK